MSETPETPSPAETSTADGAAKPRIGNTALRFISVAPLIPFILWLIFGEQKLGFRLFILLGIVLGARELFRMTIPESKGLQLYGIVATAGLACVRVLAPELAPERAAEIHGLSLSILAFGALVAGLVVPDPVERAAARSGWLLGGPIYVAGTLSHLVLLHGLPHGGGWVLLSMFLAWLSDTGAYFAGLYLGKHKLYPKLSPKKTVEGAIGGLAGSVTGAVIIHYTVVPELPLLGGIVLALVAGALGQAGDLFESLLKRSTGVKDSGALLPGHGGMLDRVDALMFTATATWIYASWILPGR